MAELEVSAGLDGELAGSRVLADLLLAAATRIADEARGIADAEAFRSGDYARSIKAVGTVGHARVVATDWKAGLLEFGSVNNEGHSTLSRGAEAAGFTVEGAR